MEIRYASHPREVKAFDTERLREEFLLERREISIINVGGPGVVTVDGQAYAMASMPYAQPPLGSVFLFRHAG